MHSPLARALRNLERYCVILVHTLKHLKPAKCVINITNCTHIFIMTFHNKNCLHISIMTCLMTFTPTFLL